MRIAILLLLAACEIQPAPKKQPAPVVENTGSAQPATPPAPPPAPADAAVADGGSPTIEASEPCIAVAAHVAEVFIQSATDPAQKAVYEQEREKMIRATSEACSKQAWPDAAQKCYLATKTPAEIKACETKFPPAPAPVTPKPVVPEPRNPAEKKLGAGPGAKAHVEQRMPPNTAQP